MAPAVGNSSSKYLKPPSNNPNTGSKMDNAVTSSSRNLSV